MDSREKESAVNTAEEKSTKNMAKKKTTGAAAKEELQEPVIYLGPYLRRIAAPGTVLANGLTPALEKAKKENPAIGELLVPLSRAAEVRRQIQVKGSAMNLMYQNAENFKYSEVMK